MTQRTTIQISGFRGDVITPGILTTTAHAPYGTAPLTADLG